MQLLLTIIIFAFSCGFSCFAQEASLKARTIDGSNVRGEKGVIYAKGNVEMKNDEVQINSEEIVIQKETKQITLPVESKIVYSGLENEMTIFSKTLDGNTQTKNVEGTGIKTLSDMISYQAEKLKIIQPVVTFEKIKFSTCQMFEINKTDASKATECSVPWNGYASKLVYNTETKQLKANNMFINLHGFPIFYTPYLSVNMNAKKDGFQQFNLVTFQYEKDKSQQGLTFLYIKKDTKYGNFIIQPELYLKQDATQPSSRVHNIKLTNEYESGAFQTKTDFKTTLLQTNTPENTGLDTGKKDYRYYLMNNNKYYNENSSTSADLQLSSDRFVMQVYDLKNYNYLISNFNYNNYINNGEKNRFYNIDATYYKAMTASNQSTIPSFVSSATYKTMLSKQHSKAQISSNSEILNFQRITGTSGTRANTALEMNKMFKLRGFEAETKPSLNLYHYTYRNSQNSNLNFAYRAVGDVNATISQSFSYNIKNYITQIKPMIFLDYTTDQTRGTVINEDSATSFVTDENIFTMSKYNGVDVIDSGLKGAYGLNVQMQNKQNRKFSFFAGQRYNTESCFSDYVGRANASLNKVQMSSKFIVQSDQAQILLSNSSISIQPFSFITAGLGYFYLDKSLQNQTANLLSGQPIVTTENITYSGSLNYKNHSIFANIVQNLKFFSGNNTKPENIITQVSGGIGYSSNCLQYKLGAQNQLFFNGTTNMSVTSFIFEISMTS